MRTYSANTEALLDDDITRPLFIFEIGFSTAMRLSSRETVSWDGDSYVAAGIRFSGDRFRLFNEANTHSAAFLAQGTAGISCKVWQLYGEPPFAAADADLIFSGELGAASMPADAKYIEARLIEAPVLFAPRLYPVAPAFNHIPPDGTEFTTPNGVFVIERS